MRRNGFTLAEILITLGIIGVVAALTTPMLMQSVGSAEIGPKLAKAVSTFELANENLLTNLGINKITNAGVDAIIKVNNKAIFLGGPVVKKYTAGFDEEAYTEALTNYMKMSRLGGRDYTDYNSSIVTTYKGDPYSRIKSSLDLEDGSNKLIIQQPMLMGEECDQISIPNSLDLGQKYLSKDGVLYVIKVFNKASSSLPPHKDQIGYVHIDINGLGAPNALARDVFVFELYNDGTLQPLGGHGASDGIRWDVACNATTVSRGGMYCAGSIFENDLKVIYP